MKTYLMFFMIIILTLAFSLSTSARGKEKHKGGSKTTETKEKDGDEEKDTKNVEEKGKHKASEAKEAKETPESNDEDLSKQYRAGKYSIDFYLPPVFLTDSTVFSKNATMTGISMKMLYLNDFAFRGKLVLGNIKNEQDTSATVKTTTTVTSIGVVPGLLYYFANTKGRVIPYVGAEIIFLNVKNKIETATTDPVTGAVNTVSNETKNKTIGLQGILGAEYFFVTNFSFFLEYTLGYQDIKNEAGGTNVDKGHFLGTGLNYYGIIGLSFYF